MATHSAVNNSLYKLSYLNKITLNSHNSQELRKRSLKNIYIWQYKHTLTRTYKPTLLQRSIAGFSSDINRKPPSLFRQSLAIIYVYTLNIYVSSKWFPYTYTAAKWTPLFTYTLFLYRIKDKQTIPLIIFPQNVLHSSTSISYYDHIHIYYFRKQRESWAACTTNGAQFDCKQENCPQQSAIDTPLYGSWACVIPSLTNSMHEKRFID